MGQKINKEAVRIMQCEGALCKSDYQDKAYGGKRLHNPMPQTDGSVWYRCTVCSKSPGAKGGPAALRRAAQRHALQIGFKILLARINAGSKAEYKSVRKGYK